MEQIEHRQDLRVETNRTFTVCIAADSATTLGVLTDISRGGLSFRYVDFNNTSIPPGKFCRLMLIDSDRKIFMNDIPARVVYDRDGNVEYPLSLTPIFALL